MNPRAIQRLSALIAPPRCSGCGRSTDIDQWICTACRSSLTESPYPSPRNGVAAAFEYRGTAKTLVGALKFSGATALAAEMAELMVHRTGDWLAAAEWIVAAPAHPERRRARGYNQSLLLARAIAAITGARAAEWFIRDASRPPQSQLGRRDRLAFPAAAITLDRRALRQWGIESLAPLPTNVVVCDDVATTGITLELCTQAIRERQPEAGREPLRAVAFAVA